MRGTATILWKPLEEQTLGHDPLHMEQAEYDHLDKDKFNNNHLTECMAFTVNGHVATGGFRSMTNGGYAGQSGDINDKLPSCNDKFD
jgi:hypothetical protein